MQDAPVITYETSLRRPGQGRDCPFRGNTATGEGREGRAFRQNYAAAPTPPHREIGCFLINAESSVAAGVRRIEAVAGMSAVMKVLEMKDDLKRISNALESGADDALEKIQGLKDTRSVLQKQVESLKGERARNIAARLMEDEGSSRSVGNRKVIVSRQDDMSPDELRYLGDLLKERGASVVILGSGKAPRGFLMVMVDPGLASAGVDAVAIVRTGASALGGSGGGKKHLAQAGGKDFGQIDKALELAAAEAVAFLGRI